MFSALNEYEEWVDTMTKDYSDSLSDVLESFSYVFLAWTLLEYLMLSKKQREMHFSM